MTSAHTTTTTEYGVRHPDGTDHWADADGDVALPEGGFLFSVAGYAAAHLFERIAAKSSAGILISRVVTTSIDESRIVSKALPTTPGSIIRAAAEGASLRDLWCLTPDTDTQPWRRVDPYRAAGVTWAGADSLDEIEVLFVAPEA